MSPRVSVLIPTYNYGSFLPAALESVLAQTYTDYEILVLDAHPGAAGVRLDHCIPEEL